MVVYEMQKEYKSKLDLRQTERAIKFVKDTFEKILADKLNLERVSAPLFVLSDTGLNDNLNGVERAVDFDIKELNQNAQIVHSLAKWKRLALKRYGFCAGEGLYTDMNAIRRDEEMDNLHSIYVDQWDWEKVIDKETRNEKTLRDTVNDIVWAIAKTKELTNEKYPVLTAEINTNVHFITTKELYNKYPNLAPKERENAICKEYGTVFIMQIGDYLENGEKHDGRAPDYDDWKLNGDILVWYEPLNRAVELSSMGIRVDSKALNYQLNVSNKNEYLSLPFHRALMNNELPLTMGGGIGQSRLCMLLLEKVHVGEVQASIWGDKLVGECEMKNITLL